MIEEQKNNPLHGVKLEALLTELVDHYGWELLAQAININCFKSNPSIKSSLKFLRRTDWAREKVEGFYLYKYKRLPKPDDEQYELPPRDRMVPLNQKPRAPAVIDLKEAGLQQNEAKRSTVKLGNKPSEERKRTTKPTTVKKPGQSGDVWSHWRKDT